MKKTAGVRTPLKPILIYALALLFPILWLLVLEYQSLVRQQQAIQQLTDASMRLDGARTVTSLERTFEKWMDDFLRDPRTAQMAVTLRSDPHSQPKVDERELGYGVEGFYSIQHGRVLFLNFSQSDSTVPQIARVLEANIHLLEDTGTIGKVYPLAITRPVRAQLFYMALRQGIYIAVSLNLNRAALKAVQSGGPLSSEYTFHIVDGERANLPQGEIPVRFQTMFPFWQLAVSPDHSDHNSDRLIFLALTTFVFVLLIVTLLLLMRASWRHWELMQLRTTFIRAASHELRTPASNILLYAELLADDSNTVDETREFQDTILSEAQTLSRIVKGFLDFSRLQGGKRPFVFTIGDLRPSLQAALRMGLLRACAKGVHLTYRMPDSLPLVRFDASAVEVCVTNLVDNAVKYSTAGQSVDLCVTSGHRGLIVAVRDRGPGIAKELQKRIFDEFVQGDGSEPTGYGLGLYVVKQLMNAHGGKVEVDSQPGFGSEFRLVFPIKKNGDDSSSGR